MGVLYALAALVMHGIFWGFIALVAYLESIWVALAVALPFLFIYRIVTRQMALEDQLPGSQDKDYDPTLNAFQQPLAADTSEAPQRRKLPG